MDGPSSLSVVLSGRSPITRQSELVTLFTREVADEHIIYALFIAAPAGLRAIERDVQWDNLEPASERRGDARVERRPRRRQLGNRQEPERPCRDVAHGQFFSTLCSAPIASPAIGKDVGDRDITTAAVAAVGAIIGRKVQEEIQENRVEQRTTTTIERRCAPVGSRKYESPGRFKNGHSGSWLDVRAHNTATDPEHLVRKARAASCRGRACRVAALARARDGRLRALRATPMARCIHECHNAHGRGGARIRARLRTAANCLLACMRSTPVWYFWSLRGSSSTPVVHRVMHKFHWEQDR